MKFLLLIFSIAHCFSMSPAIMEAERVWGEALQAKDVAWDSFFVLQTLTTSDLKIYQKAEDKMQWKTRHLQTTQDALSVVQNELCELQTILAMKYLCPRCTAIYQRKVRERQVIVVQCTELHIAAKERYDNGCSELTEARKQYESTNCKKQSAEKLYLDSMKQCKILRRKCDDAWKAYKSINVRGSLSVKWWICIPGTEFRISEN